MDCYLGIDCGTSGLRGVLIHREGETLWQGRVEFAHNTPQVWQQALWTLMDQLGENLALLSPHPKLAGVAVDGTSGTLLLQERHQTEIAAWRMYDQSCPTEALQAMSLRIPPDSAAHGSSSGLAKALSLLADIAPTQRTPARWRLVHQADFLVDCLTGQSGHTDVNNALKLGYDPELGAWPRWLTESLHPTLILPSVHAPGALIACARPEILHRLGQSEPLKVFAGTTDSIAAYHAAQPTLTSGVTSLGSTLVLKQWSPVRIDRPEFGIYSHRYRGGWLVGGASNTGGRVLKAFFDTPTLQSLSAQIPPQAVGRLGYYPLLAPGERFPRNDPNWPGQMTPRPREDAEFLLELLSGMADIEAEGYALLHRLGAPSLSEVLTCGGGSANPTWTRLRERKLGIGVKKAAQMEAAYGMALWALQADGRGR